MQVPLVDLYAQYLSIQSQIDDAIAAVIEKSAFIGGEFVRGFENEFAKVCGVEHCVGVGNGTDALQITLSCLGLQAGDEVITAVNSFVATAEAISATGARVVFCDIEPESFNLDPERLAELVGDRTKAVIPVHLFGRVAAMDRIGGVAAEHDLFVIEDAAQAHGARFRGDAAGSLGRAACFSFYPGKNLGAYGDAGAIVTDDGELAKHARMYANHGRLDKFGHEVEGVNSRLDGLQAAILTVKLGFLKDWSQARVRHATTYRRLLDGIDEVVCPDLGEPGEHVFHLFVIRADERDRLREFLLGRGVQTGIHYPRTLANLRAYRHLGHEPGDFQVASAYESQILSLPMYPELSTAQIEYVVSSIRSFYGR